MGKKFLSKNPYYEQSINSEIFNIIYEVYKLSEYMCIIHFEKLKKKIAIPIIHTNYC